MKLTFVCVLVMFFYACVSGQSIMNNWLSRNGYQLFWQEEFSGNKLDPGKWKYRGLGRRGDAINTTAAIRLNGKGNLVLECRQSNDSILSGIIDSEGLFETKYGYFECRAKLTRVNGVWPGFWLQSRLNQNYGNPSTEGAEIDVFEYFHHLGKDSVAHTLHWGGYGFTHKMAGPVFGALKKTADDFHVFGFEWTPTSYKTFVDGELTYSGSTHISHVPEFLVISLEVNEKVAGKLDVTKLPVQFLVDYVRVYKKTQQ